MNDQATIDHPTMAEPDATLEITAGIASVQSSVAIFDKIRSGIAAIQAEHPADVEFDLTMPAGMKRAIAGRAAWRDPRIALGKARQAAKAPVLALGRQIDAFAAGVEAQLRVGESHYHALIEAEETRREKEREARARAEEERVEAHRQRIQSIRAVAARAVGMTSEQIAEKIALVTRLTIGDDYEEFAAPAINAKAETLLQLQDMHAAAVRSESAAAEAERNRLRLEKLEREDAERRAREETERVERERAEAAALEAERARQQREAQLAAAARALSDEIRQIQRRAFSVSAQGMLELVTLIENIQIGEELGQWGEATQIVKDEALADLHHPHAQKVQAEAELRAARAESERLERLAEQRRAELERMQAPPAGPVSDEIPEGLDSQHVLKAEAGTPDATDRDAPATMSPVGGPMGAGQPAAAGPAEEPPTVSTGEIGRRLGFPMPAAFILATLRIPNTGTDKRALLWRESQWLEIKAALVAHINGLD